MKIKDLKESQLKEYNWSELFRGVNRYGSAQMAKPKGATTTGYLSQQMYIDDFVSKLSQAITNAVATGQIDLNAVAQAGQQPSSSTAATSTAPASTTASTTHSSTAGAQSAAASDTAPIQQSDQAQKLAAKRAAAQKKIQKKVDKISKQQYKQPAQTTQEPAQTTQEPAPKQATTAQPNISMKYQGKPVSNQINLAPQMKAARQQAEKDWERHASGTNESRYHALNNLFEAIIREQEGTETLQDYIFDLLAKNYPNVGVEKKKPYISSQIEELRKAILADKGQVGRNALNAIKKFGQAWFAISQSSAAPKEQPKAAATTSTTSTSAKPAQTAEPAQTTEPAQAATTEPEQAPAQTPAKLKIKDIKSAIINMKTRQKQDLINFIQKNMSDLGKTEKPAEPEPEMPMQEPKVAAAGGGGTVAQPTRKPNLRIVPK